MSNSTHNITTQDIIAALSARNPTANWDTTDFETLLSQGWNINESLSHIGDALILAVNTNNSPTVHFLLTHGADPNVNLWATTYSPLECAATSHADLTIVSLLLAARQGRIDILKTLLGAGVGIDEVPDNDDVYDNARRQVDWGTALHGAAGNGRGEVVGWLVGRGARMDVRNGVGLTAEEGAREKGFGECERLLRVGR